MPADIFEDDGRGVQHFAFILSVMLFVGFDLVMLISSHISFTLHWCCWLYFLWMHSMKLLRSEIDRRENHNWMSRTNNVTEAMSRASVYCGLRGKDG